MQTDFDALKKKLTTPQVLAFTDIDTLFVVEMDASSIAVGAVWDHKGKDGKINSFQFASWTMKADERN